LDSPSDQSPLRSALRRVLWIGGAPDAGKTTVARELAQRRDLALYVLDRAEPDHVARADPERRPEFARFLAMSMDERWVLRSPREMAEHVIATGPERLAMAIDDLLRLPDDRLIVAEGPWFFPDLLAPLLAHPRQALWLVPTAAFKRASAARRDKPAIRHQTSDPERATCNWLARDLYLADYVRRRATALDLPLWEVDGILSIDTMVAAVEDHFRPLLPGRTSSDE
jgi:hypothetical protein